MRLFRAAKVHLWIVPAFIGVAALATVFLLAMTLRPGFTISFYVENAVYYTIRTNGNQNISFPKEPTKTGYVFEGWFFDNGTWNEPFEKDTFRETKLEENKNVYAKFTAKQTEFTVSFSVEGEIKHSQKSQGKEVLSLPQEPQKEGFTFAGWFFDDGVWEQPFNESYYAETDLTKDVVLYAKFTENPPEIYTIKFMVGDVEFHTTESAGKEVIELPETPIQTDYTFNGWFFDEGVWEQPFDENYYANSFLPHDIVLYAKFTSIYATNLEYVLSADEQYYIVAGRGECTSTHILIPETHEGLPVKEIGAKAFYQDATLVKLIVSKNVEKIQRWALSWCPVMEEVKFEVGSKLSFMDEYIFNCSKKLATINIPKEMKVLPKGAFSGCEALVNITFENPNNITEIGPYAFSSNPMVEAPAFNSLEKIGDHAFSSCSKLKTFYIPKTLKIIEEGAFNETRAGNKKVYVEDANTMYDIDIGDTWAVPWMFNGNMIYDYAGNLITTITIPEGVTEVKKYTYHWINCIEEINIPTSVKKIGAAAFSNVLKLKRLNINANIENPEGITMFDRAGQYTMTNMGPHWTCPEGYRDVQVTFGENVTSIPTKLFGSSDYTAFIGTITFKATNPPTFGSEWIVTISSVFKQIKVPTAKITQYKSALGSALASYVVGY